MKKKLLAASGIAGAVVVGLYLTCTPPWVACHKAPAGAPCTEECQFWQCGAGWNDGPCPN